MAAVRSLPLAERLALMASGAMHDEGSSGITKRRRGRRTLADAAEDGAKKKPEGEAAAVDSWGVVAKPTNKHAPTEVSSKKPVPRLRAMTLPPTGGGRRRKARGALERTDRQAGSLDAHRPPSDPGESKYKTRKRTKHEQTRASTQPWGK